MIPKVALYLQQFRAHRKANRQQRCKKRSKLSANAIRISLLMAKCRLIRLLCQILQRTYFQRAARRCKYIDFPTLFSNIAYKLLMKVGNCSAFGPIVLGLSKSVHVLHTAAKCRKSSIWLLLPLSMHSIRNNLAHPMT